MRIGTWIVSALVAFGAASCGGNGQPGQSQTTLGQAATSTRGPGQSAGKSQSQTVRNDVPEPPKGAIWTIYCDSVQGPAHVDDASLLKSRLIKVSGMHDWYVIHSQNESTIYYGYYGSLNNPSERARADRDRTRIAKLTDNLGNRLVRGGIMVAINAPDPPAPADWNLLNAPKGAYWTIEIATFADNPKRKQAAVDAVRELRAKGETDAYFYQGPTASSVCIGAWPRDAVAEQGTGIDSKGAMRDDAHTASPNEPLLVFAGDAAPPNIPARVYEPGTGKPMAVEGIKLDVLNPDMKSKMTKFPYHYTNYELRVTESKGQEFPASSVLVVIPRSQAGGDNDWQLTGGGAPANPQPTARPAPSSPGDSVLRSIGDR